MTEGRRHRLDRDDLDAGMLLRQVERDDADVGADVDDDVAGTEVDLPQLVVVVEDLLGHDGQDVAALPVTQRQLHAGDVDVHGRLGRAEERWQVAFEPESQLIHGRAVERSAESDYPTRPQY